MTELQTGILCVHSVPFIFPSSHGSAGIFSLEFWKEEGQDFQKYCSVDFCIPDLNTFH